MKIKRKEKLRLDDFRLELKENDITVQASNELIKLLQKDGYGRDLKPGISKSEISTKTRVAEILLWGRQIEVLFDDNEVERKDEFILTINDKLKWLHENKSVVFEKLSDEFLELKNSIWLSKNESPINSESFTAKIKLKSVVFSSDGSFNLYLTADELFHGHEISLAVDSHQKLGRTEL